VIFLALFRLLSPLAPLRSDGPADRRSRSFPGLSRRWPDPVTEVRCDADHRWKGARYGGTVTDAMMATLKARRHDGYGRILQLRCLRSLGIGSSEMSRPCSAVACIASRSGPRITLRSVSKRRKTCRSARKSRAYQSKLAVTTLPPTRISAGRAGAQLPGSRPWFLVDPTLTSVVSLRPDATRVRSTSPTRRRHF